MNTLNIFESSFHTRCEKQEALRIKLAPFLVFFTERVKSYTPSKFFFVCVKLPRLCKVAPVYGKCFNKAKTEIPFSPGE